MPVPGVVLEATVAYGRQRSGPLFYGLDAGQLTPRSVSGALNRVFKRHRFEFTAHQLRHPYGRTAYQISKDFPLVQELLGHYSPTTTARYAAFDKSQTVETVRRLDDDWSAGE